MGSPGAPGSDRNDIVSTVAEMDRRLRAACLARDLVVGSAVVLGAALVLEIAAHLLPLAPAIPLWVAALGVPAFAALRVQAMARRRSPARAASVLDRRANLRDELVSAHWFACSGQSSPPVDLHLQRAALAARRLELGALAPLVVPRRSAAAAAAALVLVVAAALVPVDLTRAWVRGGPATALTETERARLDAIARALGGDTASGERAALKARIDELLRRLRDPALSAEEALALVDELRRLIAAASPGSEAAAVLARTGAALAGADVTSAAGEALRSGQLDEAAQRMRELAASIEDVMRGGASPAGFERALASASAASQGGLDELARNLADAAAGVGRRSAEDTGAALDRASGNISDAAQAQEFEESLRAAGGQLDQLMQSLGSRAGSPRPTGQTAESGERQGAPSSDMSAEGARRAPGEGAGRPVPGEGQNQQGAMVATADRPGSSAPGPLGAPSIAAVGAPMKIEATRRREVLPVDPAPGEAPREQLRDEETRATRVTVEYRPVDAVPPYAEAGLVTPAEVPWPYRDLVKAYFRLIGQQAAGGGGGAPP